MGWSLQSMAGGQMAMAARRPTRKHIVRAHMTALARQLFVNGSGSNYHRALAVNILQARRRATGR